MCNRCVEKSEKNLLLDLLLSCKKIHVGKWESKSATGLCAYCEEITVVKQRVFLSWVL